MLLKRLIKPFWPDMVEDVYLSQAQASLIPAAERRELA